jgi:aminopeptidase-like protein
VGVTDAVDMMALLRDLAPLHRTLACTDTDRSFRILAEVVPGAIIESYPTGSAAWTWTIPQRWELRRATIRDGARILVDSDEHHLHCVNYSQPFRGRVSREELLRHIRTNPERPSAIPFAFAFYQDTWGFCVPHERLGEFTAEAYDVEIDCHFENGDFNVLTALAPGRHEEEFILCANICHPTQVNDSLTGLAAAVDVFVRLAARSERKYSYRLLVVPETIGSLAYLSRHPEVIERAVGGFFCEMLGTGGEFVLQATRLGNTYWDHLAAEALRVTGHPYRRAGFMKSAANDEKCLDSPGVDIPTVSVTRYPFPEYHTSDDCLGLIDPAMQREGRDVLQAMVDLAESDYVPVLNQPGPIFLSGHGLYPDLRSDPSLEGIMNAFYDVMYALDGTASVCELANRLGRPVWEVAYWTDAFASKGLLTRRDSVRCRSGTAAPPCPTIAHFATTP